MFLIGLVGGAVVTFMLILMARYARSRGNLVRSLLMGGLASVVLGITLILLNVGGPAHPALMKGIGWIAFAPDYVRLAAFAIAIVLFASAALAWLISHLSIGSSWLIDKLRSGRDSGTFMKNVTPFGKTRQSSSLRTIEEKMRLSKQRSGEDIDIKLPTGNEWREAE